MQLISQKISTSLTTMPIINSEEGTPRPVVYCFKFRLDYVQDDRNSVFVVIPYHALVSISRICHNHSIFLASIFSCIIVLFEPIYLIFLHLLILFTLFISHFHSSVHHNRTRINRWLWRFILNVYMTIRLLFMAFGNRLPSWYESLISYRGLCPLISITFSSFQDNCCFWKKFRVWNYFLVILFSPRAHGYCSWDIIRTNIGGRSVYLFSGWSFNNAFIIIS